MTKPKQIPIEEWQPQQFRNIEALRKKMRAANSKLQQVNRDSRMAQRQREAEIDDWFDKELRKLRAERDRRFATSNDQFAEDIRQARFGLDTANKTLNEAWDRFYDEALERYGVDYRANMSEVEKAVEQAGSQSATG